MRLPVYKSLHIRGSRRGLIACYECRQLSEIASDIKGLGKVSRLTQWLVKEQRVRELEQGNPELAGSISYRASVETLQEAPQLGDEEKVRS